MEYISYLFNLYIEKHNHMITSKGLYTKLASGFKTERTYSFTDRGEGMMECREKTTDRGFLINKKTTEAWKPIHYLSLTSYGNLAEGSKDSYENIEDNASIIFDDFIESVNLIYSGNLPTQ